MVLVCCELKIIVLIVRQTDSILISANDKVARSFEQKYGISENGLQY